jgi:hypothetical protein
MARRAAHSGTDNVLLGLGIADAEELTAKVILAKRIDDILESRGLTQLAAAKLLAIPSQRFRRCEITRSAEFLSNASCKP